MRTFIYSDIAPDLLTNEIVNLIAAIQEHKGRQNLFIESKADILESLLEIAKVQSTEASNRIEGIFTSDQRIAEIVKEQSAPLNRSEREIAGYRDVLATIHENYDYMPPRPNVILQLHRDLYKYSASSIGGRFKNTDNQIEETDEKGNTFVRFQPVSAFETPTAIEALCNEFRREVDRGEITPILLAPMFVLDFLCIHPFNDGNGRMSRLLTLLLLYRSGYIVGKYISIERLIEKTKETYYDVLQESSRQWHDGTNNYSPFVVYTLGIVLNAYREFSSRVDYLTTKGMSKPERIAEVMMSKLGKITVAEIQSICPDISYSTITKTLTALMKVDKVLKVSGGRYSAYIWNRK